MSNPIATQTVTQITPEIHRVPPITGFVTIWGISVNPMVMALIGLLCIASFILWKAQRAHGRNTFDVWDLIMDTLPDGSRRASGIKTSYQGAFLMASWVIVDQEIKGTLSDGVFGLYLGGIMGPLIAKVVFDKKEPPQIGGKP